jgi:hypothetical protein
MAILPFVLYSIMPTIGFYLFISYHEDILERLCRLIGAGVAQSLRPDRLWGPPSLLFNGYRRLFPRG